MAKLYVNNNPKIDRLSIRKILNLVLKIKGSLMVELPTQDMRQAREGFFT